MRTQKEYLNSSHLCPACGKGNVEGGPVEIDEGTALQEVSCIDCGADWNDHYKLISFERTN